MPARSRALFEASTGAIPYSGGSTACTPRDAIRAIGSRPIASTPASFASSSAAAPSFSGDALPAVTDPSSRNAGFSLASFSSELSARIGSSRSSSTSGTPTVSSA